MPRETPAKTEEIAHLMPRESSGQHHDLDRHAMWDHG